MTPSPPIVDLMDIDEENEMLPSANIPTREANEADSDEVLFLGVATQENPKPTKRIRSSAEHNEEDDRKPAAVVKKEPIHKGFGGDMPVDGEDIQEVEGVHEMVPEYPTNVPPYASLNDASPMDGGKEEEEEEVAIVGTRNRLRLPHMRQHCTEKPFGKANSKVLPRFVTRLQQNTAHCDLCYCYVCDVPVKSCKKWSDHCYATDTGKEATYYKRLRQEMRIEKERQTQPPVTMGENVTPVEDDGDADEYGYAHGNCMHCNLAGYSQVCTHCGRTTSKLFYAKSNEQVQEGKDVVRLGIREMSFRMVTTDLRTVEPYAANWSDNEGEQRWEIDHVAEANDVFRRKMGYRPKLSLLLGCVSPYRDEQHIPATAEENDRSVIFLDDPKDGSLLHSLSNANRYFGDDAFTTMESPSKIVIGNINVSFSAESRLGTITLEVFAFKSKKIPQHNQMAYACFFGYWVGVLPLTLSDLRLHIPIESDTSGEVPEIDAAIDVYNNKIQSFMEEDMSLSSGIKVLQDHTNEKNCDFVGGVCRSGTDLRSLLIRYACEKLADCAIQECLQKNNSDWSLSEKGFNTQSTLRRGGISIYGCTTSLIRNFLDHEGHLLLPWICESIRNSTKRVDSLDRLMDHFVNRGHKSAPFVEGLTVELLPFQLQSLQWAMERESCEGGVQTFFNSKISIGEEDVFCNFITGKISTVKPNLVRGGIIADQMGLGKTVISLALILKNPAPKAPAVCSPVLKIDPDPDKSGKQQFWDPNLYQRTTDESKKRGEIISHGTLVVCKVSLVGQWISEAKSKLSDPGLIYQYHGSDRKRDPMVLAKNAIVVTTYETLSSDNTYHRSKSSKRSEYCPPCEQVRWWRIICDESHLLRNQNTSKSDTIMNLVADNKWLVSGTPINTHLNDLKNQLKFVGLDDVPAMLRHFNEASIGQFAQLKKRRRVWANNDSRGIGLLSFLVRPIMIRHTQSQKYAGTNTTLMSLPPLTEKDLLVEFSPEERTEYDTLETNAREFFNALARKVGSKLSSHYLKLQRGLTTLRIACSGGHLPLENEKDETKDEGCTKETPGVNEGSAEEQSLLEAGNTITKNGEDVSDDAVEDKDGKIKASDEITQKVKKPKKKIKYSDFCFNNKMEKLIEQLTRIRDDEPLAKSLIFSQFKSTLQFLEAKLPEHGFQCRTLSGSMTMTARAKALQDFQNDPPTTLFLLSMGAGAVGINLTAANRIFLLEPSFNPAVEAQAIGRVHRLGQKRPVEITRMFMKDSVETRLRQLLKEKYGGLASGTTTAMVGSISNDKATLMKQEFDLLYGCRVEARPSTGEATLSTTMSSTEL